MDTQPPPPERPGLPWDQRARLGFFPALVDTVRVVLLEPAAAFKSESPSSRMPLPASMMMSSPPARTSTQGVLPP